MTILSLALLFFSSVALVFAAVDEVQRRFREQLKVADELRAELDALRTEFAAQKVKHKVAVVEQHAKETAL